MNNECRICQNKSEKKLYNALEKHFGTFDEFQYFECPECLTLQITSIPDNLANYYPENYFSKILIEQSDLKLFIKKMWFKHYFNKFNIIGNLISILKGPPQFYNWFKYLHANPDDAILDVGSGTGILLSELQLAGFKNLTGADPYIMESIFISEGLKILKCTLKEIADSKLKYKHIIFNCSFEHIPDPLETMKESRILQNIGDNLIIRIPVAGSFVWEKYGTDWVALDAPRHLHILSETAMEILANKSSYKIHDILYDSADIQFWGSELYKHNIPMTKTKFGSKDPMRDFRQIVSKEQSNEFKNLTNKLNHEKKGDQATFFLKAI